MRQMPAQAFALGQLQEDETTTTAGASQSSETRTSDRDASESHHVPAGPMSMASWWTAATAPLSIASVGLTQALGLQGDPEEGVVASSPQTRKAAAEAGDLSAQLHLGNQCLRGGAGEHDQAMRWFKLAAEQGSRDAYFALGFMHEMGFAVQQDDAEALYYYRMAAAEGHMGAQYGAGALYAQGRGAEQDNTEALKWFRMAAEQGDADAQRQVGEMFAQGRGARADMDEARKWLDIAAAQGNADAQKRLSSLTKGGGLPSTVRPKAAGKARAKPTSPVNGIAEMQGSLYSLAEDRADAAVDNSDDLHVIMMYGSMSALREKAENGDPEAQLEMGDVYLRRKCTAQDYAQAAKWFRLAAAKKSSGAQFALGFIHEIGLSVQQDDKEALHWYMLAASQNHTPAQYAAGMLRAHGHIAVRDEAEAFRWFRKAAEQGNVGAQRELGIMLAHGRGKGADVDEARHWFERAADGGDAEAPNSLGSMAANGLGRPKDLQEAVRYFRMAADRKSPLAQKNLGDMHAHGHGLPQDDAQAISWYRLAADQQHPPALKRLADMHAQGRGVPQDRAEADRLNTSAEKLLKEQRRQSHLSSTKPQDYLQIHLQRNLETGAQLDKAAIELDMEPPDAIPTSHVERRKGAIGYMANMANVFMAFSWRSRKFNTRRRHR